MNEMKKINISFLPNGKKTKRRKILNFGCRRNVLDAF